MQGVLGLIVFIGLAWAVSRFRGHIHWRTAVVGLGMQLLLAYLLLGVPFFANALLGVNAVIAAVESATRDGTSFVFGFLGGAAPPYDPVSEIPLYLFAFRVLPQILVFSVLVALLWYWRILPLMVRGIGWALQRTMGVGGAVGTAGASTVFLGMIETPLVIRAYLLKLSRSEFFTVMTCGMATVSGSIMILYANLLGPMVEGALGHIITASVVNVIGAVYLSRLIMPDDQPPTSGDDTSGLRYTGNMDAITRGTMDGLQLAMSVGAMVLVLVALVSLVNYMIGVIEVGGEPLSLERITGPLFAPVAWLVGIPWADAQAAGSLLATKLILNELIAYVQMADMSAETLSDESRLIMTYALCGFTNFASLGILLGGLTTLVPDRREELMQVGPITLFSGTLTALVTGCIVGIVLQLI